MGYILRNNNRLWVNITNMILKEVIYGWKYSNKLVKDMRES